jgi:transglutaminase-like putative cysteine protease
MSVWADGTSSVLSIAVLLDGIDGSDTGVARLFERVRDIPFRFAAHRDADTLLACGAGTCAPKHALLARLYEQLGLETRFLYVSFRFDEMPGQFPPALRRAAHDGIVRGHAALRVRRPHGWIDIDATFDRPLAAAGFVVTQAWDGRTSMPLVVTPLSRVESTLPPEHEERLLGIDHRTSFPRAVAQPLNEWLDRLRQEWRSSGHAPLVR